MVNCFRQRAAQSVQVNRNQCKAANGSQRRVTAGSRQGSDERHRRRGIDNSLPYRGMICASTDSQRDADNRRIS